MFVRWAAREPPKIVRDCETGHAAPAVPNMEKFEGIDESEDLLLRRTLLEHNRENSRRTQEISLPEFVAGTGRQGGMENKLDFGGGERASVQSKGRKIRSPPAELPEFSCRAVPGCNRRETRHSQLTCWAAPVLIEPFILNGDGTEKQGPPRPPTYLVMACIWITTPTTGKTTFQAQHARGPCVIQHNADVLFMRGSNNSRKVLNFHRDRSRTFAPDQARVLLDQFGNIRANTGIVEIRGDTKARKQPRSQFAVWIVDACRDKYVVSRLQQREVDQGNGRLPPGGKMVRVPDSSSQIRAANSNVVGVPYRPYVSRRAIDPMYP